MKKKLFVLVAALASVLPFTAKAWSDPECASKGTCYVYDKGQVVNFITGPTEKQMYENGDETVGQLTVILDDKGTSDNYVRALSFVFDETTIESSKGVTGIPYSSDSYGPMTQLVKNVRGRINQLFPDSWEYAKHNEDGELVVDFISLDEVISVFGATANGDGTYKIDMNKVPEKFLSKVKKTIASYDLIEKQDPLYKNLTRNGFFTNTYDETEGTVWVVEFDADTDGTVKGMTAKKVPITSGDYAIVPVAYFDKTYDCHSRENQAKYSCYSCGEEYIWTEVGTQAETCEIVSNINAKSKCVKNAKTGVEEYILEFVCVIAICGAALLLTKRQDLFKNI